MGHGDRSGMELPQRVLGAALDALPLAVVVVDGDDRVLYANPAALRLVGDGLRVGEEVRWRAPGWRLGVRGAHAVVGASEDPSEDLAAELLPGPVDGMLEPMTVALGRGEDRAVIVLTALARGQGGAHCPIERLREVEAVAQLGSWSSDVDADAVTWSDELFRLYGLMPLAVPVTRGFADRQIHPDDRAGFAQRVRQAWQSGEPFMGNYRIVRPDGAVRWHQGRGQAVRAGGRVVRLFGVAEDITDRVEHESALRAALVQTRRLAAENDLLRSEIQAQLTEVRVSRSRIVREGDDARRRLERDLHDGAQQRLTTLGLMLRLAEAQLGEDAPPVIRETLSRAVQELKAGLAELRALARGLYPALLTDEGLPAALQALVGRSLLPVTLEIGALPRLALPVERAAYLVVAEVLANGSKHARTSCAHVRVDLRERVLIVEVSDGDAGGARLDALQGLADRVAALDGRLAIESPVDRGTVVRAELPCA